MFISFICLKKRYNYIRSNIYEYVSLSHANGRIQPPKSQKEALVCQKGTPVLDSILTRKNPPAIGGEPWLDAERRSKN